MDKPCSPLLSVDLTTPDHSFIPESVKTGLSAPSSLCFLSSTSAPWLVVAARGSWHPDTPKATSNLLTWIIYARTHTHTHAHTRTHAHTQTSHCPALVESPLTPHSHFQSPRLQQWSKVEGERKREKEREGERDINKKRDRCWYRYLSIWWIMDFIFGQFSVKKGLWRLHF